MDTDNLKQTQEKLLGEILARNSGCHFGQLHRFDDIRSAAQYKKVPFMTYDRVEGFDGYWDDPENYCTDRVVAFFLTSGSSAAPKRIPVTTNLVREKARAFSLFWDRIYADHPVLKRGNFIANFADSGHFKRDAQNRLETSETAFWNQRMQGFQQPGRWPLGRHLTTVEDASLRYYAAARLALQGPLHCMMSLNPSTLVRFCTTISDNEPALERGLVDGTWGVPALDKDGGLHEGLVSRLGKYPERAKSVTSTFGRERRLKSIWPELELIVCWQSQLVEPYLKLLRPWTEGVALRDYITQSSECMMAIPVADNKSGGTLASTCHFFEFIPEAQAEFGDPDSLFAWQVEPGANYEIVVTTSGGLYRYRTGDCVRVKGSEEGVPTLEFLYRLGKTSSITGEKLTEAQVVEALRVTSAHDIADFSEAIVFPSTGEQPHYRFIVAADHLRAGSDPSVLEDWGQRFDEALASVNGEYRDKQNSLRLGPVTITSVSAGHMHRVHQYLRAAHVSDEQYKPGVLRREHDLDRVALAKELPDEDR